MTDIATLGIVIKSNGINEASSGLNKLTSEGGKAEAATNKLSSSFDGLNKYMQAAQGAFAALGMGAFVKQALDAALAMERINSTMKATAGTAAATARELAFVREESQRLGLEFRSTAEAYAKFSAASKGTSIEGEGVRKIFKGVSEAATAMRLTTEQSNGVFLALQQMMSKGTVQAEELRGQLAERLPGAFGMAAKAMGMTTQELGKQLELGKVLSSDLLPKLAEEMHKTYGTAAIEAATGGQAAINRFKNSVFDSASAIGTALMPAFTGILNILTPLMDYLKMFIGGIEILAVKLATLPDKAAAAWRVIKSGEGLFSTAGMAMYAKEKAVSDAAAEAAIADIMKKYMPVSAAKTAAEMAEEQSKVAGALAKEAGGRIVTGLKSGLTSVQKEHQEQIKSFLKDSWDNAATELAAEDFTAKMVNKLAITTMGPYKIDAKPTGFTKNPAMSLGVDLQIKSAEQLADIDKDRQKVIDDQNKAIEAQNDALREQYRIAKELAETKYRTEDMNIRMMNDPYAQEQASMEARYERERALIEEKLFLSQQGSELEKAQMEQLATLQIKLNSDLTKSKKDETNEAWNSAFSAAKKAVPQLAVFDKLIAASQKDYIVKGKDGVVDQTKSNLSMYSAYAGGVGSMFEGLAEQQDQSSRKGFETAKAFNTAAAVMSTAAAIMNAMATVPYPASIAMAAIAAATGVMQIAQIQATSFGGGGTVAGVPSGAFGASGDTAGVGTKIGPALVTGQSAYGEGDALQLLAESAISASLAIGDLVGAFESVSESFTTDSAVVSMFRNSPRIVTEPDERILQIVNAEMAKSYNIASNAATALGTNVNSGMTGLGGYQRGNGKGNTPEVVAAFLNNLITEAQDLYAKSVTGLIDFTNVGERAWDALQRLTGSLYTANDGFERIGMTLLDGLSGANMANKISVALGGDDEMQTVLNDYFEGMFTESEQNAAKLSQYTRQVNEAFYLMGEQVPETKTGFQNLVNSMDTTTDSGAELFVKLMEISPAFIGMKEAAEDLAAAAKEAADEMISVATDALRDSIDAEIKMLQDRANITAKAYATAATVLDASYAAQRAIIVEGQTTVLDALKTGLAEATKAAATLQTTFDMLKSAREGMQLSGADAATIAAAQSDLMSILDDARNGDTSRIAGMADTAQIVSGISADSYTNSADYQRAFWQTSNSLLELETITGKQLTDAQQQVESLNTLITATTTANAATLKAFDAELNAIKGISANILPISEARMQYKVTKAADAAAQLELTTQTTWLNKQYDMLTNVNTSVLSVQEAMNNLAGLLGKPAPSAVAPANPMAAYAATDSPALRDAKVQAQNKIAYDSSDTGLLAAAKALYASTHGGANTAYYNAAAASVGGDIGAALGWNGSMEDTERLRKLYSFDVGTNYVPYDMTAQIHEGERIIPKADNYRLAQDNKEMIAELKVLRAELKIQNGESAKWNQRTAKILDKWDGDGMPAVAA